MAACTDEGEHRNPGGILANSANFAAAALKCPARSVFAAEFHECIIRVEVKLSTECDTMRLTSELLMRQLQLADALLVGRDRMLEPQDLPGRYGRVARALDHVLQACDCESVVGGGWAVWRHGYVGRVTQDIDIVLPANRVNDFLQTASVSGFEVREQPQGRWPKLLHRETGIDVDILPEGGRPGTASRLAPTTIPHPQMMGAIRGTLTYISLSSLVELKLAAGRLRDEADIEELIRENQDRLDKVRQHLEAIHPQYARRFVELIQQVDEFSGQ